MGNYNKLEEIIGRFQWPRGIRSGSAVAGLLELRVRFPSEAGIFVSSECCVLSGIRLATGWSLIQRSPTECGVSECDREALILRRTWTTGGCWAMGKKKIILI
jgi:hypothetical protein